MHLAGFEHAISAHERPQTHALDRTATGICCHNIISRKSITFILSEEEMSVRCIRALSRKIE